MSYRDLRNFTEMLRTLEFPRLVSIDNFRQPNFPLVAEILIWIIRRIDATATIPTDVEDETDRVLFVKAVAQFMATKLHLRLNTKRLYEADGHAVKELIKATSLLYNALKSQNEEAPQGGESGPPVTLSDFNLTSKIGELKVRAGAGVPAFMDEYEKLEAELAKTYETYIEKFRNISYLEQELEQHNRTEQDKLEETEQQLKRMQARLRDEEMRMMRGSDETFGLGGDMDHSDEETDSDADLETEPRGVATYGSMRGGMDSDEGSDLSDSFGDIDDDDDDDDLGGLGDDLDDDQSDLSDDAF
ncbi:hypothetical protein PTSG_10898 [Salpingoeca rosetta]|uniref:Clusterin-associated protein 1 n=1 Tax=Salpingoeca rosetta (strain ATCC 50818 / BSB-021) TaxID=946362 RepID=F2URB7_SALR5|nr:uncharacterized protein PTSG_10898 [Salpingoeca rosetta]EGD80220.1 hypothetical protein PTSG_10898 [Salpingoeca rosetta]|eukprot:XP_004988282.1 hypothetical protein PTSG_10898 [Salpingoeca rosetta]